MDPDGPLRNPHYSPTTPFMRYSTLHPPDTPTTGHTPLPKEGTEYQEVEMRQKTDYAVPNPEQRERK